MFHHHGSYREMDRSNVGIFDSVLCTRNKTLYTLAPDFSMYDYYVELNHAKIEKFETSLDGLLMVDTVYFKWKK